jgi:predicted nucleic acid-binding Zn ribbon protein
MSRSPDDPRSRALRHAPKTGDVVSSRPRKRADDDEIDEGPLDSDIERFSDPTRTCPECKKTVFDDVAICYHCGYAFEARHERGARTVVWAAAVAATLVIAFLFLLLRGLF